MHMSAVKPAMFDIRANGSTSNLEGVLPGFSLDDRVGLVVRTPYGGLGASYLFARAMASFYAEQTMSGEVYPDYFLFSVGRPHGDHSMLDLWPDHHEVTVENDAERILQAVNDRGITRLLIEETPAGAPEIANWTRESALSRLRTAIVFAPSGATTGGDLSISANAEVEHEIGLQLDPDRVVRESAGYDDFLAYYARRRDEVSPEETARLRLVRESSLSSGRRTETYRAVTIAEALTVLETS